MKRLYVFAAAMLAFLAIASTANADPAVGPFQWMRFENSGGATGQWITGNDSPSDSNSKVLRFRIPAITEGQCQAPDYANCPYTAAFSRASTQQIRDVTAQKNLSWDYKASNVETNSQRMSVQFGNGDVAFLDSVTCHRNIAVSGGTWRRADFTGFKGPGDCTFTVSGTTGGVYANTPEQSAWTTYALAHPDESTVSRYLIVDTGGAPLTGVNTYFFDRVSLGANKMYIEGAHEAVDCLNNENRC
jgi:hypothetical protein